ncbi:MAG: amidase family protein [Oscillospiraceae bacterium]|nr:amidase family protein [Oscillospiraceae bacterium]
MDYFVERFCDDPGAVALDQSIMLEGKPAVAGSKILEGFRAPFTAAVLEKLQAAGVPLAGYARSDEFGADDLADESDSLSALIGAVAQKQCRWAIGNDWSGRLRRQAARNGVCYLHPTYGTVSRYGLVAAVCSMDQIGVAAAAPADCFALLQKIAGCDPRDGAMYADTEYAFAPHKNPIKIGIPANVLSAATAAAQKDLRDFAALFESVECQLPHFSLLPQVQYILSAAEFSHNINRYDGIKFGHRAANFRGLDDLYRGTRTEGFGEPVKLAAMAGAMALSQEYYLTWYDKAMRIRRLLKDALDFAQYDVLVLPNAVEGDKYTATALYALATLAGLPSLSVPFGKTGIQLLAAPRNENVLLAAAERGMTR